MDIEFTCKYCLESHVVEDGLADFAEDAMQSGEVPEYPEVCPHCKTTRCAECGGILKPQTRHCQHCGEIEPEFSSNCVRAGSTSAAYAERSWISAVKRWNDRFGQLEDENHRYEIHTNLETEETHLKEVTIEDGNKVTLNKHKLSENPIDNPE